MKGIITLAIAMMILGITYEGKCQSSKLSQADKQLLVDAANNLADCRAQVKSLSLLINDTALLKAENNAQKDVITRLNDVVSTTQAQVDKLIQSLDEKDKVVNLLKDVNAEQDKLVKKLGNPKKWAVAVFGGYGVGGDKFGTLVAGVGISRTIFAF